MAWMKIDLELPDKPEVHAIAGMLNLDPDAVVGKLIRVWQWFDKHTTDGNAFGVTYALPDRISSVAGFGEAMAFVGWLEQRDKTLVMLKFDRHTSESAKARALTAKRVEKHKAKTNANETGKVTADALPDALPREEKDKNKKHIGADAGFCFKTELLKLGAKPELVSDWLAVRSAKKARNTKTALDGFVREVGKSGWAISDVLRMCCERNWQGFNADWVRDSKPIEVDAKPRLDTSLEARRAAMQAQADESYKSRAWLNGEKRYRTVFKIEDGQIKPSRVYDSGVAA